MVKLFTKTINKIKGRLWMDRLDGRLKDIKKRGLVSTPVGPASYEHCIVCGKRCGLVTEDGVGLIIAVCDECHFAHGPIPGLQELTEREIRQYILTGKHN